MGIQEALRPDRIQGCPAQAGGDAVARAGPTFCLGWSASLDTARIGSGATQGGGWVGSSRRRIRAPGRAPGPCSPACR